MIYHYRFYDTAIYCGIKKVKKIKYVVQMIADDWTMFMPACFTILMNISFRIDDKI